MEKTGKVIEIISAVLDVRFDKTDLPEIHDEVIIEGARGKVTAEVAADLGDGVVRCIAMGPTDGLKRGDKATALGHPIMVPVGDKTLGRIFNVLGDTVDVFLPDIKFRDSGLVR